MNPEELRPRTLDEMVGQTHVIRVLKGLLDPVKNATRLVPHLLFSGAAGLGKTSAAHAFSRALLGDEFDGNFYEMNASDQRKVDDVRETIAEYVGHEPHGEAEFKVLLLDEADYLTPVAQAALRRLMENGSATTRFILTCNDPYLLIPALHSRCLSLRFHPLTDDEIRVVVQRTAQAIHAELPQATFDAIVERADGEPRRAVFLVAGGDEEVARWANLEDRLVTFLKPDGHDANARVESLSQWLRQEGIARDGRDAAQVLDSLYRVATRKKLIQPSRLPQATETVGQYCFRIGESAVPLLHVRAALYAWLRVTEDRP